MSALHDDPRLPEAPAASDDSDAAAATSHGRLAAQQVDGNVTDERPQMGKSTTPML